MWIEHTQAGRQIASYDRSHRNGSAFLLTGNLLTEAFTLSPTLHIRPLIDSSTTSQYGHLLTRRPLHNTATYWQCHHFTYDHLLTVRPPHDTATYWQWSNITIRPFIDSTATYWQYGHLFTDGPLHNSATYWQGGHLLTVRPLLIVRLLLIVRPLHINAVA